MSFSISAMGTSVPATPRSSAIRTWSMERVRRSGESGEWGTSDKLHVRPGGSVLPEHVEEKHPFGAENSEKNENFNLN